MRIKNPIQNQRLKKQVKYLLVGFQIKDIIQPYSLRRKNPSNKNLNLMKENKKFNRSIKSFPKVNYFVLKS